MDIEAQLGPKPPRMSTDEFLAWVDQQPEGRFELVAGEVVRRPLETVGHVETKMGVCLALRAAAEALGPGIEAMGEGVGVRTGEDSVLVPDAWVRRGPRLPGESRLLPDPMVLVEVVSPLVRHVDTGLKLKEYFRLPSLHHYLVLDSGDRTVVHHLRVSEDRIDTRILRAPVNGGGPDLVLDPPGLTLAVSALFDAP